MEDRVFVEDEVVVAGPRAAAQAAAQLLRQGLELAVDPPDVFARPGLFDAVAPDRLAFHELGAQDGALVLHAFGQERIAVAQAGDALEDRALGIRQQDHTGIVRAPSIGCTYRKRVLRPALDSPILANGPKVALGLGMTRGGYSDLLKNGGFQAFLWTQFLGAFNDSVYQTIVALHAGDVKGGAWVPLVPAVFTLPALLFSGYSGHLADRVSKRSVLIGVKVFEIAVMLFGLAALATGWTGGMLLVVFLMGLHATVFSPAKYGIVPEMLPDRDLSRGNALLEMSTFVSIVLGIAGGGLLFAVWRHAAWRIGAVTAAIALAGFLSSLRITRVAPSGARQPFQVNPFGEIGESIRHLVGDKPLWLAVLGVSYFWFAGVLLKINLQYFGLDVLHASDNGVSLLWAFLAIGIGAGNLLAGRLSGDKVELGLVPLGAILMSVFAFGTCLAGGSLPWAAVMVSLMALSSGLFVVPLYAYIQQRSGRQEKGRVLATNNFLQTIGMLMAAALMLALHTRLHIGAGQILLGFGVATLLVAVYILTVVPDYFVRFVLWLATHSVFRIRIAGQENVPFRGPALMVSNHMSQIDGLLIGACVQRFIRFLVWKPYYEARWLNWFMRLAKAIPVGSGREALESIRTARQELADGHVVCIFAEGSITRTGNLLPFKRGMERIAEGMEAPIIPVHLDGLWGSIFSFERGRFLRKWPKRIPYPVTVSFGAPMPARSTAHEVRQAIQELGAEAAERRKGDAGTLDRRFVRNARRHWNRFAMADSTGRELTYGRLLTAGLLVARQLPRGRADRRGAASQRGRSGGERRDYAGGPRPGQPEFHGRARVHGGGCRAVRHTDRRDDPQAPGAGFGSREPRWCSSKISSRGRANSRRCGRCWPRGWRRSARATRPIRSRPSSSRAAARGCPRV